MRICVPHFFKHHDKFINIELSSTFMLKPWYTKHTEVLSCEVEDEIYNNYAGWLWFNLHWYSSK